jgi:hypothetical protein
VATGIGVTDRHDHEVAQADPDGVVAPRADVGLVPRDLADVVVGIRGGPLRRTLSLDR